MSGFAKWFFFESIYGTVVFAAAVWAVAHLFGKLTKRDLLPAVWGGIAFVICLVVLPSLPRFQFEKEVRAHLKSAPWVRVVEEVKLGSLLEPLTWFVSPVGVFRVVSPDLLDEQQFTEFLFRYDQEPVVRIIDVACVDREYYLSVPDSKGTFRILPETQRMTDQDFGLFCIEDWSERRKTYRSS